MLDPTTMQPRPCPACASRNVRWRARGIPDRARTWLRYGGEFFASAIFDAGSYSNVRFPDQVHEGVLHEMRESRVGLKTPEFFWKCADCRKRGYVFLGRDVIT